MQPGFNIFAWYKVIDQAKEIHCIDSALANFIEAVPAWRSKEKTPVHNSQGNKRLFTQYLPKQLDL